MNNIKKFPDEIKNHLTAKIKNNLNFFSKQNNTKELFENNYSYLND